MRIFQVIILLILATLSLSEAYSGELSSGTSTTKTTENSKTENSQDSNCPKILVDWVQDDFSNKVAGGISLDSESHQCLMEQSSVNKSPEQQGKFLRSKYKNIIPDKYQAKLLNDCQKMNQDLSKTIQTRFYSTGARIESANMMILNELSYYDSILPKPIHSEEIQCTSSFPRLNNKCTEYKNQILNCSNKKELRLEAIVAKTESNLRRIIDFEKSHRECVIKNGKSSEACNKINAAIELLKSQTPWIKGEVFSKFAGIRRTYARDKSHYSKEKMSDPFFQEYPNIQEAVEKQIAETRKDLKELYSDNIENFRCFSYSGRNDGKSCDFNKIRTQLLLIPNAVDENLTKDDEDLKNYLKSEDCFLTKGAEREKTKTEINNMAKDIALTIGTSYLGALARATYAIKGAAQTGKRIAQANVGLGLGISANELKNTYDRCEDETKKIKSLTQNPHSQLENICDESSSTSPQEDHKMSLEVARENETNCLLDVLLSAPDVLPFVGSIPGLAIINKINKKRKAELDDFIGRMKNTDKKVKDLDFAGALEDHERLYIAKGLLGKKTLTPDQEKALIAAHNIGGKKGYDEYTIKEVIEKKQKLIAGGFTNEEANVLVRKGIAGSNSSTTANSSLIENRLKEYFGPANNFSESQIAAVHRINTDTTLKGYQKVAILEESGFTNEQAMELIKPKFHTKDSKSSSYTAPEIEPTPSTTINQKNSTTNPYHENSNLIPNIKLIESTGSVGHTKEEVKKSLFEFANSHGLKGSYDEKTFAGLDLYLNSFKKDFNNMKAALNSTDMLNSKNRETLERNFKLVKENCRKIKDFAILGGYNGPTIQQKIQDILDSCNRN